MNTKCVAGFLAAVAMLGGTAMAQSNTYSGNAVGFVRVDVPGSNKLTMVSTPFNQIGAVSNTTLDALIGTNLTANWDITAADVVYLWDGAKYRTAFLNNAEWGDPSIDWKWCYMAGGTPKACATTNAFDVYPGRGFWILNRGASKTLYLCGEVPNTGSNTVSIAGLQMIAYPFPVAKPVVDLISTNDGAFANWDATAADIIYLWDGSKYQTLFYNDADWGDPAVNWKWCYMAGGSPRAATNTVSPGQGFWYLSRKNNFVWKSARPYAPVNQ